MKNVILTHNELQLNLFLAFTYGLQQQQPAPNLHIVANIESDHFEWQVLRDDRKIRKPDDGELVFNKIINKGEYRMNDVRLGVTIAFLRDQAAEFIKDLNHYYKLGKQSKKS